jgi:hypothetical protein
MGDDAERIFKASGMQDMDMAMGMFDNMASNQQ